MDTSQETPVSLLDAARDRYLVYALSVITGRALPDVRDGLKPVQRRILYGMYHNLKLGPDGRYRKSAAVVGEVMAKYHPHGDQALYDAMCRMAQDFSLLHPLVDGQGNFGSLDGDRPAAMRYTEARLKPLAVELLGETSRATVDWRPSYDGQNFEPITLPAQFPHLWVNGAEGIAVGMATSIPPHNLREVIDATLLLLEEPDASTADVLKKFKGPDFPTGGELVASGPELLSAYTDGKGSFKLRASWTTEVRGKKTSLVITSVPYGVQKSELLEKIGESVQNKKLPQVVDVRDESTHEVRILLELRSADDAPAAMAWLYKHTDLQISIHLNLTCLVPTENPEVSEPKRVGIVEGLLYWITFRRHTLTRRTKAELDGYQKRIHILAGYAKIFDALDETIRIIRGADGKADAAEKLMARFGLDDEQTEAILELKLYRLAKLELNLIQEELKSLRAKEAHCLALLESPALMDALLAQELQDLRKAHGQPRRTRVEAASQAPTYDERAYIVAEDCWVIVTRDAWIKRQGSFTALDKVRVREGDSVGWMFRASTRSTVCFLGSHGAAYTMRVDDIASTSGHGGPVQAHFQFEDGEEVVGVISLDPRNLPCPLPAEGSEEEGPALAAVSLQGRAIRLPLEAFVEVSTRKGRKFMKIDDDDDKVLAGGAASPETWLCLCTRDGAALAYPAGEIPLTKGAGKGVTAIDLRDKDQLFAAELSHTDDRGPVVQSGLGFESRVTAKTHKGARASRGHRLIKRGIMAAWKRTAEVRSDREGEA